jgi:hypothetical protein
METPDTPADVSWLCICRSIFSPRRRPWIVLPGGFFLDKMALKFFDCGPLPTASFPENLRCVGSTNSWVALDFMDDEQRHKYFLHNPFSKATVLLRKLDAIIGDASELFRIYKVLMRSTPDDLIAVTTNNCNCPIILIQSNKCMWFLNQTPFVSIIDVAFLGDRLYGITKEEDLVSLHITFDDVQNIPMVTVEWVIWSNIDDDSDVANNDEDTELNWKTGDGMIDDGITFEHGFLVFRYLLESCGNILMVRRQLNGVKLNYKVEVFKGKHKCEKMDSNICWTRRSGTFYQQTLQQVCFCSRRGRAGCNLFYRLWPSLQHETSPHKLPRKIYWFF